MAGRRRCVVVVADDFGRTSSVNRAIAEAHEKGIVTAASIMAGGESFEDAVRIVREAPRLSVGLHVTLCDGRAVLSQSKIPDLVDRTGHFKNSPSVAWMKCSRPSVLRQVEKEIEAQFDLLEKSGIRPSHVDSHHHIHMQPSIFSLLCQRASQRRVPWVRVPWEPFSMIVPLKGRGALPFIEWAVFGILGNLHRKRAGWHGVRVADRVYGLSRTGHLDEDSLLNLIDRSDGITEIFSHPDSTTMNGRRELEALTSPAVRSRIASLGITLGGYRELAEDASNAMVHISERS